MSRFIAILFSLLTYCSHSKEINIANCNELWDMTNSINKQPLYQVKIYSCIIPPALNNNVYQLPIDNPQIKYLNTSLNSSNTTIKNISNSQNNSFVNKTYGVSLSSSETHVSPSPSSFRMEKNSPSPIHGVNNNPSPSSVDDKEILDDEIFDSEISDNDIIKKNSLLENQTNQENQTNDNSVKLPDTDHILNIVIGVLCGICVVIIILVFVWKKRKNKITDKNTENITLESKAAKTKPPHIFNKTNSSKTDETVINIPHNLNNRNRHNNSNKSHQKPHQKPPHKPPQKPHQKPPQKPHQKPHQKPNLKQNINETKVNSVHKKRPNKNHTPLNNTHAPLPTRIPQLKQKNLPTLPHENNDLEAGNVH